MASLSLQLAQWNWITRADAGYLMGDGKNADIHQAAELSKIATRKVYKNNVVKILQIIHHLSSNSMRYR
jgi:hypothetical protein